MKAIQHGVRISAAGLSDKELYRTADEHGVVIVSQRGNKRLLSFDSKLEQSSVLPAKPHYLVHEYTQIMLLGLLFVKPRHATVLGLGGGALVHCLSHYFPQIVLQVVELRQVVIDIAYDWFALPERPGLQVQQQDAACYLSAAGAAVSDIIFSDLYAATAMSDCQAQQTFINDCARVLSAQGCLVLNFHSMPAPDSLLMQAVKTGFEEIIVYYNGSGNCLLFCCKKAVSLHLSLLNGEIHSLVQHVDMPLTFYYRKLEYYGC